MIQVVCRRRPVLLVLCLVLGQAEFSAAIVLQANFDQASLDVANSSVNGSIVELVGRDNHNPGNWKWLYFSASDLTGQTPFFRIDDHFETGGNNLVGHQMVYSYDQQGWDFFDNHERDAAANSYSFWNNDPFTQDQVYVAYGLPYPLGRAVTHTQSIKSSPWVTPTLSANANLVIGQSPGGTDDLARNISPHDLMGYRITDLTGVPDKTSVLLASGVHANETLGNYVLEGLVDFLTGDEFEAALLRKYADFHVYPMVNPDGRFAGYNRSTVANEAQDPNRFWLPSSYGGIPEVGTVATAMLADTSAVDYLIDFHSTVVGNDAHYGLVHPAMQSDPFWQSLLALDRELRTRPAALIDDTLAKFGRDILGAEFSITFETQFIPDENIDRFQDLGRSFGLAFSQALTVFGDLDLNGELAAGDFQVLISNAESDLMGLASIDAYLHGDLNGDGQNNIVDFGIFKDAVDARLGPGAFARMLLQIPESDVTPFCSLMGFAAFVLRRTRRFV